MGNLLPISSFFPPPSCHGYALNELKWWLIKRKCLLDGRTRHPCVLSMWIKPLWSGGTLLVFVTRVYANTRLLSPGSVSQRERSCCALQISLSPATNLLTFTVINFHCVSTSLPCHDGYLFDFAGRMLRARPGKNRIKYSPCEEVDPVSCSSLLWVYCIWSSLRANLSTLKS